MTARKPHPVFGTAVLELACAGGLGGGSVEISAGTGRPLAASDPAGTIADSDGIQVLRAALRFDGPHDFGTNAMLDVIEPDGTPLGEVRVEKYSVTPRSSKATLSLRVGGTEVARLQPGNDRGEFTFTVADRPAGTLRKMAKRGFIRTVTTYRLELTGDIDERTRQLIVATAIRYHSLVYAAASAST